MEAIAKAILHTGDLALVLSVLANCAMAWFIVMMRKEDRQDRAAMANALKSVAEALDKVRIVVAALTGNRDL